MLQFHVLQLHVLYFHVLHFHASLLGPVIFTSCVFSAPRWLLNVTLAHFYVQFDTKRYRASASPKTLKLNALKQTGWAV